MEKEKFEKALEIDKEINVLNGHEKYLDNNNILDYDLKSYYGPLYFSDEEIKTIEEQIRKEFKRRIAEHKTKLEKQFEAL